MLLGCLYGFFVGLALACIKHNKLIQKILNKIEDKEAKGRLITFLLIIAPITNMLLLFIAFGYGGYVMVLDLKN